MGQCRCYKTTLSSSPSLGPLHGQSLSPAGNLGLSQSPRTGGSLALDVVLFLWRQAPGRAVTPMTPLLAMSAGSGRRSGAAPIPEAGWLCGRSGWSSPPSGRWRSSGSRPTVSPNLPSMPAGRLSRSHQRILESEQDPPMRSRTRGTACIKAMPLASCLQG